MYAPTSTISPRSGRSSGDAEDALTDFDGVAEVLRTWGAGLRPDPDLTVSEWADRRRARIAGAGNVRFQYRCTDFRLPS